MRDFESWLKKLKQSIATYDFYIDFKKVYSNTDKLKVELNILNSLIGSKDIENDFEKIIKKYPETLKCIPVLLAVREHKIFCSDNKGEFEFDFNYMNLSVDKYIYFMRKTGLFELLEKRLTNNLVDYVLGVETGSDSNGRKNRGGHLMENLVESYIKKAGFVKDKTYFKEIYLSELEKKTNLNLNALSNNGETKKRFDFAIISKKCVYGIECNFYTGGGSKLNETARSYKTLALESKGIKGFKFVWITDGIGWKHAKNNLKETFDVLDDLYSINDLENGVLNHF